jgi:hypothetical protein
MRNGERCGTDECSALYVGCQAAFWQRPPLSSQTRTWLTAALACSRLQVASAAPSPRRTSTNSTGRESKHLHAGDARLFQFCSTSRNSSRYCAGDAVPPWEMDIAKYSSKWQ